MAATEAKRQANRWPALLDAAAAKFAELGYHATTIRELAAATDMTPGAIYFHVPSKQALLLAVYEEGVQRIVDHVEQATAARPRTPGNGSPPLSKRTSKRSSTPAPTRASSSASCLTTSPRSQPISRACATATNSGFATWSRR